MNLFQSGKNYLALLGINSTQNVINARSFFASFVFFTNVGLDASFLFYEANSFLKYANSIFLTATVTMIATIFYIAVLQGPNAFEIIDLFEKLVEKSEYFIIQKLKFTGMRTPTLKSMCEEKKPRRRKVVKISIFIDCQMYAHSFGVPQGHVQLLDILHHGCRKRCLRFAIFDMVSVWLENSDGIFCCCRHTIYFGFVFIYVCRNSIIHCTWRLFCCNVNTQRHRGEHKHSQRHCKFRRKSNSNDWTTVWFCLGAFMPARVGYIHLHRFKLKINSSNWLWNPFAEYSMDFARWSNMFVWYLSLGVFSWHALLCYYSRWKSLSISLNQSKCFVNCWRFKLIFLVQTRNRLLSIHGDDSWSDLCGV